MELLTQQPTSQGPVELFTGAVWFDVIARGEGESRVRVNTVHTPPGEEHWHGALSDRFMSHLAVWEDDDATWGDHVTDEEHAVATALRER